MENSESSGNTRKKILFITLFVVPFLLGMALIFMGKDIGTLPTLFPNGKQNEKTTHYKVPEFSFINFQNKKSSLNNLDSSIYLVCLFSEKKQNEWDEHLFYISKIIKRYQNMKVFSIYEVNDTNKTIWKEDPSNFIQDHKIWAAGYVNSKEFNYLKTILKAETDTLTGHFPYLIIDKSKHIRAFCPINDLKAARDVPNLLKILNNQYAPRRIKIRKKDAEN